MLLARAMNTAVASASTIEDRGTSSGLILQFGVHAADTVVQPSYISSSRLTCFSHFPCPLPVFASAKCDSALLERLELATTVALQAGAAMKLVINMKNKNVIHKGVTDL